MQEEPFGGGSVRWGSGTNEGMTRRFLAIVVAVGFWCAGGLLLSGSAGFLFSAVLHRFATDGWIMSALGALVLGGSGSLMVGIGSWLTYRVWNPSRRELVVSDDGMWLA